MVCGDTLSQKSRRRSQHFHRRGKFLNYRRPKPAESDPSSGAMGKRSWLKCSDYAANLSKGSAEPVVRAPAGAARSVALHSQ
jgi:hypothetical protein